MPWTLFDSGASLNTPGSEDGTIIRDEEYDGFSRITLERETPHAPFAITCGIYGWMVHTRFLGAEGEAHEQYDAMKGDLAAIVDAIPPEGAGREELARVTDAIGEFVERFP